MNCELPDIQAGFRKGRGTRYQIANIRWIIEKARIPEKHLLLLYWGFPHSSFGKESACNAGDQGLIPGLVRFAGEGRGYPLQYSGQKNSMDCGVRGVTKSQTRLSCFNFHLEGYCDDK